MMMPFALFALFIVLPLLELALLIKLGSWIGVWATIAVLLLGATLGFIVMQHQGAAALRRAMQAMSAGEPPTEPMLEGMLLMLAGTLLLIPGLMSDVAAALLLVPPLRRALARRIARDGHVGGFTSTGSPRDHGPGGGRRWRFSRRRWGPRGPHPETGSHPTAGDGPPRSPRGSGGTVIDGEFERLDERPVEPRPKAGDEPGRRRPQEH